MDLYRSDRFISLTQLGKILILLQAILIILLTTNLIEFEGAENTESHFEHYHMAHYHHSLWGKSKQSRINSLLNI